MLTFSVQIDLEVQADSLGYVEEMTAELEQVISSHFDDDGLLEFDYEIVQREQDEETREDYEDQRDCFFPLHRDADKETVTICAQKGTNL